MILVVLGWFCVVDFVVGFPKFTQRGGFLAGDLLRWPSIKAGHCFVPSKALSLDRLFGIGQIRQRVFSGLFFLEVEAFFLRGGGGG